MPSKGKKKIKLSVCFNYCIKLWFDFNLTGRKIKYKNEKKYKKTSMNASVSIWLKSNLISNVDWCPDPTILKFFSF